MGRQYSIQLAGHNLPGMCIDLIGGYVQNGQRLQLWGCNGLDSQKWSWDSSTSSIRYAADRTYCIDVPGGNPQDGNQLWIWQCNGGSSQKWQMTSPSPSGMTSSRSFAPVSTERQANSSNPKGNQPKVHRSWMQEMKHFLATTDWSNGTWPTDFVPWYERKEVKDFHASLVPGPGLPRPLVPAGWTGYNMSNESLVVLV